ncbi:MAG: STAS domain-containing protein [Bacilli bacterium]
MLEINMEFRKGILFIRLNGELTKNTVIKLRMEVTQLIKDNGIRNVLFNLNELDKIDIKGINELYYNFEICKINKGLSLLCGVNEKINKKLKESHLLKYMNEIDDELSAFNLV